MTDKTDWMAENLKNKKFIKDEDSPNYPQNKVLLVKGGTKTGIEIGLSDYCAKEYAQSIRAELKRRLPEKKDLRLLFRETLDSRDKFLATINYERAVGHNEYREDVLKVIGGER